MTSDDERPGSPAAYAANWRRVLLVDAALGLALVAAGVVALGVWDAPLGWVAIGLGTAYVLAIVGRYRTWRERRRQVGLDG